MQRLRKEKKGRVLKVCLHGQKGTWQLPRYISRELLSVVLLPSVERTSQPV